MACLGELCPLLPLPEKRTKPPKGKSRRPPHLQAICDFIFSLQELQQQETTMTITTVPATDKVTELMTNNLSVHLSNTYRQFYQHFSRGGDGDDDQQHSEELEIHWLEALNGSLDGYNWVIKCLDTVPAASLFVIAEGDGTMSLSQQQEATDKKGTKRKRQLSASDPPVNSLPPMESNIPHGHVLIRNILFFMKLCCIRLLNLQYQGVQLLSFHQSTLTGRSKQQQYHEKLILEVFRRIIQLFSVLLESDSNHFVHFFQSHGIIICNSAGANASDTSSNEFSSVIQFLLLCGLGVMDLTVIKKNYHNTQRQRNIMQTLESIASHVIHEISIPDKQFQYHFSKLPSLLSFSEILKDHSMPVPWSGGGGGKRGMGNDFQSEEYSTNIPIAIEQLFSLLSAASGSSSGSSQSNLCHLLTPSLWSNILHYNLLESLSPSSLLSSVIAMKRCLSILKKCHLLQIPFGNQYQTNLKAIGISLIQATLSNQMTEPTGSVSSSQHFSLTPTAIEVGSTLLALSLNEFEVPIVTTSPSSFFTSSSSSLIEIILSLPHAPPPATGTAPIAAPTDTQKISGEMFLQYYGNTLVDLFIGTEGEEEKFLNNCKLFLNLMVQYSERSLHSRKTAADDDHVMKRCTLLLSKICTGIIERSKTTMKEEILANFIHLYAEHIYKESLQYPSPAVYHRYSKTGGNQFLRLLCTRESIGLILHLESLLSASSREDKGLLRNSPLVLVIKKIRHFLFQNILYVFNCCSDSTLKEISSPLFHGDHCENMVKAFQLLPYVLPGTTATCPRPISPSMDELQELRDEEETVKTEVRPIISPHLLPRPPSSFPVMPSLSLLWKRLLQPNSQ
jgi:hypothetical protein